MAWDVVIEAMAQTEPLKRRKFEKSVYVQHIGLMGVLTQSKTTVVNSTPPEDVPAEDLIFQHKGGKMTLAYETHLLDNRSYYPPEPHCALRRASGDGQSLADVPSVRSEPPSPAGLRLAHRRNSIARSLCQAQEARPGSEIPRRYVHVLHQER